jgi:hypothetical protein
MKEYYYAVFMKSNSCDYYTKLYRGTPENVVSQIKNDHGTELAYMGEWDVDANDKKAKTKLSKLLQTAIDNCEKEF